MEESLGQEAALVIHQVAFLGHATPAKLQRALGLEKSAQKASVAVNGTAPRQPKIEDANPLEGQDQENEPQPVISSVKALYDVLKQLLDSGYLSLATKTQFIPLKDLQTEAEIQVRNDNFPRGLINASDKKQMPGLVDNLKRKWRDESNAFLSSKRMRLEPSSNGMNGANVGLQLMVSRALLVQELN